MSQPKKQSLPKPKTAFGKFVLAATIAYAAIWLVFSVIPGARETLMAAPYVGMALNVFTGLYVAAVIVWVAWRIVSL